MPSNYRLIIIGSFAFACGAGFAVLEKDNTAWTLGGIAVACLVGFIMLSIARVQRTGETPEQAARRREATEDKFDPDP